MSETKPITPEEILKYKTHLPDFVVEAVNELIKKKWNGASATIRQTELIVKILKIMPADEQSPITRRQSLFDNHWLDVEPAYRHAGWNVVSDKPGYNETYEAKLTFTRPARESRDF